MASFTINKGLDLPISGTPRQEIERGKRVGRVALIDADYVGLKPSMLVAVGDKVRRGQAVFEDKKTPGVRYTSPGGGEVLAINRGERRTFQSLVIGLTDSEQSGQPAPSDLQVFESYTSKRVATLTGDEIRALLIESGLWTTIRTRPYGKTPAVDGKAKAVFVTAIDTQPHAASVDAVLRDRVADFHAGLRCIAELTDGKTYLCTAPGGSVTAPEGSNIETHTFAGPHPAGLVGTHIHLLEPVNRLKTAWYINYQDVVAVGRLFTTGVLDVERVVSLAGPTVEVPRLITTRIGASIDELVKGELQQVENRVISGSVLSGRTAVGDIHGFLGRFHLQISALEEGRRREFLNWMMPGLGKYSTIRAFVEGFLAGHRKQYAMTTTRNGGDRAIVPIGMYERVMPLDIEPTFLLKSLASRDVEKAELLGALELEEEDLALCTFVCAGKTEFGPVLRENLTILENEG